MAFDDPIVWVLIVAVVIFLFGSSKIPGLAKSLGQARREFDTALRGQHSDSAVSASSQNASTLAPLDPLIQAAQKEGIDIQGKTRQQIASELSWKLNNH